ncbi:Factor arrest protein 11 [Microbotryomycetes sp. JL201]|nr:Factor arrest protein 11 [Microbotryomycetes sp. JL201]
MTPASSQPPPLLSSVTATVDSTRATAAATTSMSSTPAVTTATHGDDTDARTDIVPQPAAAMDAAPHGALAGHVAPRRDALVDGLGSHAQPRSLSPEQIETTSEHYSDAASATTAPPQQQQLQQQQQRNKSIYTFPSPPPDTNTMLAELEEFYSYVEVPQVIDHKDSFVDSWTCAKEFANSPRDVQLEHVHKLLEGLSAQDAEIRFTNARHLLYIAQGAFETSTSPEHHLHMILCNAALLRHAGALETIWDAVKATGLRWDALSAIPDPDSAHSPSAAQTAYERQECLDEINGELALYLAILYIMVEAHRGEEQWGDQLMKLDPPMPIHLLNLVAGLRERNAKGYPVKKLLLLLWKSILSCMGGAKDVARVKKLVREIEGLPVDEKDKNARRNKPETKVAPTDLQAFRNEITSKYPSYQAPQIPLIPDLERISAAAAPLPVRPTFSSRVNPNHESGAYSVSGSSGGPNSTTQAPFGAGGPGTPAPSPPPSPAPKPKKQQYQTDQTKPFVLPFAPSNAGPRHGAPRAVPASIAEAGDLYSRNMRISTELWQTWKLREEYMADESGILKAAQLDDLESGKRTSLAPTRNKKTSLRSAGQTTSSAGQVYTTHASTVSSGEDAAKLSRRMEELVIDSGSESEFDTDGEEEDLMDPLSMLRHMQKQIRIQEDNETDDKKKKALSQRRLDVQKLERIEQLYRAVLPNLQSAVIVLLKLLLATVTANSNAHNGGGPPDSGNDEPVELTLEDVDINRHREITSKAVSAILILTLKWFKTSHVMKFHYLSQLLVDSNCLLLILKMFGLQEVSTSVKTKHDRAEMNFFKFCHDHVNPSSLSEPRPEDAMLESRPHSSSPPGAEAGLGIEGTPLSPAGQSDPGTSIIPGVGSGADDDHVELVTDFSWRNFFSVINFVHILQKLTKRKTHRVLLLVQYKSSAILKRILKVSHPTLQLYVLKVIKSQVPYCGRKWRQSNMKVITAIYLHCRPDLRDEWLTGIDVDNDVEESLPHEQALRQLVRFFNTKHYGAFAPMLHRRASSSSSLGNQHHQQQQHQGSAGPHYQPDFGGPMTGGVGMSGFGLHGGAAGLGNSATSFGGDGPGRRPSSSGSSSSGSEDAFPPTRSVNSFDIESLVRKSGRHRSQAGATSTTDVTTPDPENDLLGEYYDIDDLLLYPRGSFAASGSSAVEEGSTDWFEHAQEDWDRLGEIVGEYSDISDSESVGSLSELLGRGYGRVEFGDDDGSVGDGTSSEGNVSDFDMDDLEAEQRARHEWQHISPKTISALEEEKAAAAPNSPSPRLNRRRSSTGPPVSPALRPVLIDRDDDQLDLQEQIREGPTPSEPHSGPAVDEVELVFGE